MLQLLNYTTKLVTLIANQSSDDDEEDSDSDSDSAPPKTNKNNNQIEMAITTQDLVDLCNDDERKIMLATTSMLKLLQSHLSSEKTQVIMKNTKSAQSTFLNLFQRFFQISNGAGATAGGGTGAQLFWQTVPAAAQDCITSVLQLLTTPNFLSAIKLIVMQASEVDPRLLKSCLILLGERVGGVSVGSVENTLYVELIGELVEIVVESGADFYTRQAGVVAIERLAKNLKLKAGGGDER